MRPPGNIIEALGFEDPTGVLEVKVPVLIEAFVPEAAVEAFDEDVLSGLAWCNEGKPDAVAIAKAPAFIGQGLSPSPAQAGSQ